MIRTLTAILALGLALQGSALPAKGGRTYIDVSVAPDGTCVAKIGNVSLPPSERITLLPSLVPNRTADLRLRGADITPYRCVGGIVFDLQRLGYKSIGLDVEPPPLNPDIKVPDEPGQ